MVSKYRTPEPAVDRKVCFICKIEKPADDFHHNQTAKDGLHSRCKSCCAEIWRNSRGGGGTGGRPYVEPTEKACALCKVVKPISDYPIRSGRKHGHLSRCTECRTKTHRSWQEKNPENDSAHRNRIRRYGITTEQFSTMVAAQGGVCGLCGMAEARVSISKNLSVDHDHRCCPGSVSCGRCVRGLLCHKCNTGLGHFGDDPQLLRRAAEWVNRPPMSFDELGLRAVR